jgi:hypothetical protein
VLIDRFKISRKTGNDAVFIDDLRFYEVTAAVACVESKLEMFVTSHTIVESENAEAVIGQHRVRQVPSNATLQVWS